jgi:inosose dehydratase
LRIAISSILWPAEVSLTEIAETAAEIGYEGLEGARDFMGNVAGLRELLGDQGLAMAAGYFAANWFDADYRAPELAGLRRSAEFYADVGAETVILASAGSPRRFATAGYHPDHRADGLTDYQWGYFCESLNLAADICLDEFGLPVAFKQHAGSYVEIASEVENLMTGTNPDTVLLAADTGHLFYAGIDPIDFFERNIDRIGYVHFRDVDTDVFDEGMAEEVGLRDFVEAEGFTEIGAGFMDFEAIVECLHGGGYEGWVTLTQDYSSRDAAVAAGNSLEYAESLLTGRG